MLKQYISSITTAATRGWASLETAAVVQVAMDYFMRVGLGLGCTSHSDVRLCTAAVSLLSHSMASGAQRTMLHVWSAFAGCGLPHECRGPLDIVVSG